MPYMKPSTKQNLKFHGQIMSVYQQLWDIGFGLPDSEEESRLALCKLSNDVQDALGEWFLDPGEEE